MPSSAYINVLDFKSPQELAKYMLFLDSNKTAYNSYFKWKKHVKFSTNQKPFSPFCDMCIKLHLDDFNGQIKQSIIKDMSPKFWSVKFDCRKADFF